MRLRCMPPRRTRAENYRPGKLREKPCDRVSMKEIIGLLITLSSLLVGSRGGGDGGEYSWRAEEAGEREAAAGRGPTEGDSRAAAGVPPQAHDGARGARHAGRSGGARDDRAGGLCRERPYLYVCGRRGHGARPFLSCAGQFVE